MHEIIETRRMLAVASSGGHWVQLRRLRPAFAGHKVVYVQTRLGSGRGKEEDILFVRDANKSSPLNLLIMFAQVFVIIMRIRPHIVISTGAAPGFAAILIGRLIGARTIWVDSMANSERLSLAGEKARRFCDYCFTQWIELEVEGKVKFLGPVL